MLPEKQLLAGKIRMPHVPHDWVARARLRAAFRDALEHPVILVSAPAGYGKTTFLAEAVKALPSAAAWVSLTADDNSPSEFWTSVVSALHEAAPKRYDRIREAVLSPDAPPDKWVVTAVLNATEDTRLVLVLDDYQFISTLAIHDCVAFLAEHLPAGAHLVLASRVDPPLPLARWRAGGKLAELCTADLTFTAQETAAYFRKNVSGLSARDVEMLQAKTEGWITGLKIAALSLRGNADASRAIRMLLGGSRHAWDYLGQEVLDRQPDHTRRFLLETSILERLSGPLCGAVTGNTGADAMLDALESANLFISPIDDERRWFRYHPLFAAMLQAALRRESPGHENILHRRAGTWYETEGFPDEAAAHYLAAGAHVQAVDALEKAAPIMLGQNRAAALLAFSTRIPQEHMRTAPWLCVGFAWAALMSGAHDVLSRMLSLAEAGLAQDAAALAPGSRANMSRIRGHVLSLKAFIALASQDLPAATRLAQEADSVFTGSDPADRLAKAVNALNLAACFEQNGDVAKAALFYEDLAGAGKQGGFSHAALSAMGSLAGVQLTLLNVDRAWEICAQAIAQATAAGGGNPLPSAAGAYLVRGQIHYERNNLEDAEQDFALAIQLGEAGAGREAVFEGCLFLARLSQTRGDDKSADSYLGRAAVVASSHEARSLPAWKAALALRRGDVGAAAEWAAGREKLLPLAGVPGYLEELDYLTMIRVRLAVGKVTGLSGHLNSLIRHAESQGRGGTVIEALVLNALAQAGKGRFEDAAGSLGKALLRAEPGGCLRTFLDEGEPLRRLLEGDRIGRGEHASYARKILGAMRPADSKRRAVSAPGLAEALSAREMELLGLIAAGKSNKEIASELFLAIGTVKKHTSNIFGKLGVQSRTQAVARAQQLGILPHSREPPR